MGKKDPLPPGTTRIDGTDGSITFDGEYVTITHKWMANAGRGQATFPLGAVSGVNVRSGLILAAVTIVVPGVVPRKGRENPLTVNGFSKQDAASFRDLVVTARASVDAVPLSPSMLIPMPLDDDTPVAPEAAGFVAQLQKLAELHTQGLLTAEEFGIAKAKLLGTSAPDDDPSQPW